MIKGRGYEIYIPKQSNKAHKDESKEHAVEDTVDEEMEEDTAVPLVTHVDNILYSIFSNVDIYIKHEHFYN